MTNKEFIKKLDLHRNNTHKLFEGDGGFNIKRGMGHTMSNYAEDLFALFIAQKVNSKEKQFLVDKVTSLRFNENEKAKSFKPDLSIINEGTMTHYFDLKTNMGWNREFEEYLKQKHDFIKRLRGRAAWISHSKTNKQDITISKNLIYQMVVIYGWNINQEILKKNLESAIKFKNIQVNILYHKNHENDVFEINDLGFANIFKTL